MRCEYCGSPIEPREVELGSCTSCGKVFPHVVRAAEKAELVRRVVAQGGAVEIDGDRMEARPASAPQPAAHPRAFLVLAIAMSFVMAGVAAFLSFRQPTVVPTVVEMTPPRAETPAVPAVPEAPPSTAITPTPSDTAATTPSSIASASAAPSAKAPSTAATVRSAQGDSTVGRVVASNRARYARCQEAEVAVRPSAPRRYTVAITVGPSGSADWVEVLSESSESMKACISDTTKRLVFPRPAGGSSRSIVTLSL